ncbi:DYH8 protein, partial [Polypterus senegalus]
MKRLERRPSLYRQAANNVGGVGMGDPTPPHTVTELQAMDIYMYFHYLLGMGAESLQVFLTQEESDSEELEEEDLLKDDTVDEYDEAFYKMKEISSKSQANKLYEDLENAKYDLEEARNNLKHAKNQILEMVLVMLGLLPYAHEMDLETARPLRISTEFSEGRRSQKSMASLSARNSKKLITKGSKMDIKEKVDKNWWKALQNYVNDSSKFVELIHNIAQLEDGLQDEVLKEVEAYLAKPTEGNLGVTGEDATPQTITPAKKFSASDSNTGKGGITIAAARYSSEEAAVLVAFVVALVEYTHLCGPLKACLRRVQELEGEKQDLEIHKQELETEYLDNMQELWDMETNIVKILSTEKSLLNSLTINKKLCDLKQRYEEELETKSRLEISEKSILSIKEGFKDIALRGAVMFDIAYALRRLNSLYHVSYNQLLGVFDSSIANSERYSVKTIVDRVTYNIFCYVGKYLLEKDRIIYSLLLALEMETSLGHISPGMVEFIFSPDLCSEVMKAIGAKTSEARQQAKNPFDWMTDEQFKNVQVKGPEGLDELSPLQRLLVIRAVRNDRFIQAASLFISGVLGKKYSAAIPSDLQSCLQQSKTQTPILLLYDFEADVPWRLVSDLSKKRSCALQVITVCDSNCSETSRVMQLIEQAMVKGKWLLLENIQNSPHFMMTLESILQEKEDVNKNFRIWVSAQTSSSLTVRLLHSSVKIVVDTPKNIKDGLMKYIQQVDTENLDVISYPEWLPAVHNLCFLHCAVRIRATCGGIVGWNCKKNMTFGIQEYLVGSYVHLRYRIPAAFFSSGTPVNILIQALDSIPRYSLDVPEGVSLHNAPNLHFGDEYYVASELHGLYSSLSPSRLKEFPLSQTSTILPDSSSHTGHGLQNVAPVTPLTYYQLKSPTEPELWEICSSILTKLPKGWSKDVINDRLKKLGGNTPFNLFIKKELSHLMNVLSEVRKNIQTIKNCTEALNIFGDRLPPAELSVARDLIQQRAAKHWLTIGKMASPDRYWTTMTWISDLQQRVLHFEKILQLGLLGIFKQQCVRQHAERTGTVEPMVFQTVITQRDKEHMRDPPQEGMFVYGLYVWGAAWHKTEAGLIDASPKQSPVSLPVIHLRCMSRSEKANHAEVNKTTDTYQCPVYMSSTGPRDPIFHVDIWKDNVPAARWALRGMKATLQPF